MSSLDKQKKTLMKIKRKTERAREMQLIDQKKKCAS